MVVVDAAIGSGGRRALRHCRDGQCTQQFSPQLSKAQAAHLAQQLRMRTSPRVGLESDRA